MFQSLLLILATFNSIPKNVPKYDVKTSSFNLYQEYKKDEIKADVKFFNKIIYLSGKVQSISSNMNTIYLAIPDPEGLTATIDDEASLKVSNYKVNDNINLLCTGAGLVFKLPIVIHCKIIE